MCACEPIIDILLSVCVVVAVVVSGGDVERFHGLGMTLYTFQAPILPPLRLLPNKLYSIANDSSGFSLQLAKHSTFPR